MASPSSSAPSIGPSSSTSSATPTQILKRPQLRASCRHCRNRKLKCTGGNPCQVCEKRNTPCVYEVAARMGRPPGKTRGAARRSLSSSNVSVGRILDSLFTNLFASASDSAPASSSAASSSSSSNASDASSPTSAAFSLALRAYAARRTTHPVQMSALEAMEQQPCGPPVYPFLLPIVVRDLVESCCWLLGPLVATDDKAAADRGDAPRRPSYYAIALATDTTSGMPGSGEPMAEPENVSLEEMVPGDKRRLALFKAWLDMHPVSSILSARQRSVLLSSSPKRPPSAMAALILSEALMLQRGEATPRSARLLAHAHASFACETMSGRSKMELALTAALFSWHHLCHTNVRVGTVYMAFACQLAACSSRRDAGKAATRAGAGAHFIEDAVLADDREAANNLRVMLACQTTWAFSQLDTSLGSLLSRLVDPRGLIFVSAKGEGRSARQTKSLTLASGMTTVILQALGEVDAAQRSGGGFNPEALRQQLIDTAPDLSRDRGLRLFNKAIRATVGIHLLFVPTAYSHDLARLVDQVIAHCLDVSPLIDLLDALRRKRERAAPSGSAMQNVLGKVADRDDKERFLLGLDFEKMGIDDEATRDEQDEPLSKAKDCRAGIAAGADVGTDEEDDDDLDVNLEHDSPMLCVAASMHLEASSYALERIVDAVGPIGAPSPASRHGSGDVTSAASTMAWDARRARIADVARKLVRAWDMGWLTETLPHQRMKQRLQSCAQRLEASPPAHGASTMGNGLPSSADRAGGFVVATSEPLPRNSAAPAFNAPTDQKQAPIVSRPPAAVPASCDPHTDGTWEQGAFLGTAGATHDSRPWTDLLFTIDDFVAAGADLNGRAGVSSTPTTPTGATAAYGAMPAHRDGHSHVGSQQTLAHPQPHIPTASLSSSSMPLRSVYAQGQDVSAAASPGWPGSIQTSHAAAPSSSTSSWPIDRSGLGFGHAVAPPSDYGSMYGQAATSGAGSDSGLGSGSDSDHTPDETIMELLWGTLGGLGGDMPMEMLDPKAGTAHSTVSHLSGDSLAPNTLAQGLQQWNV